MRVALYWTPEPQDPLAALGAAWLGRDAETGALVPQPDVDGLAALTEAPRLYGLHATLRPPMRLATGWEEFIAAAHDVAARVAPFDLPPLALSDLSGFIALRESVPCPELQALCDACVLGTDRHRLQPGADELGKRRKAGLSARQEAMLQRWGYPYVLEEWFFHVTLSRRLETAEMARILPKAAAYFEPALSLKRRVGTLSVCTQRDGGAFLVAERLVLGGSKTTR